MASSLGCFSVRRGEVMLVRPAEATPREVKLLSDIDDQETLRFHLPMVMLYPHSPSMAGRDPARVIREALGRALVFYYPLAGRLREGPGRKLMVDCTGEGVLFADADADVRLDQFYNVAMPPVPRLPELIYCPDDGPSAVLGCPLLFVQVTRLMCGGFIFGIRFNHTMCDGPGLVQFLKAVAEMARGASAPSLPPLWARDVLDAPRRNPLPKPSLRSHSEYLQHPAAHPNGNDTVPVVHRSFFFGAEEMSVLRSRLPASVRASTSAFDMLAACIWRSRTTALQLAADEQVHLLCVMTAHSRRRPFLPAGFYGNAFIFSSVTSEAGRLCHEPLGYAVQLMKEARFEVTHEYMQSVAEVLVARGRPAVALHRTYLAADVTRARFHEVDFGWGRAVYGGPGTCGTDVLPPWVLSYYVRFPDGNGEDRIVVPMALPPLVMERFALEIQRMTTHQSMPPLSLL